MDITTLIEIIIAVLVVYLFIKFIVSPVVKVIVGIIIFVFLLYLLQRFFGIGLDKILAPFGISLNPSAWWLGFDWIPGPVNYYMERAGNFIDFIWQNYIKNIKF